MIIIQDILRTFPILRTYPKDIFKSAKKFMKNSTPRRQLLKLLLLNFLAKFLTERKYLMNKMR